MHAAPCCLAAELVRWQSLHEDLHATTQVLAELAWKPHVATQVPAQLVGLADVWERWWGLGRRGPGCGLAGADDTEQVTQPSSDGSSMKILFVVSFSFPVDQ